MVRTAHPEAKKTTTTAVKRPVVKTPEMKTKKIAATKTLPPTTIVAKKKPAQKPEPGSIDDIRSATIKRISFKSGALRMSPTCAPHCRLIVKNYLDRLLNDSHLYAVSAKRKTIMARDVASALERRNQSIFGFSYR
jgi:histone H3/H4